MSFAGLLLAAGSARRFAGPKLLERRDGRTLAEHALAPMLAAGLDPLVAVIGPELTPQALFPSGAPRVVVVNRAPGQGLSGSLRLGFPLAAQAPAVFVALADMPLVRPETYRALAEAWRPGRCAVPLWRGRRGNPVLIDAGWGAAALPRLKGDRGFGPLLCAPDAPPVEVATCDPGVLFDVDTPKDAAAWREMSQSLSA